MDNINNSNRKLFFDYHMLKNVTNIAEGFDAEELAKELEEAHVEVMSTFLRCGGGYRYYRKGNFGTIHPSLPKNLDMVEETIKACHKRNIKVIGYCSAWHSEPHQLAKNNCMKTRLNGETIREICGNSPVFENEILPQFTEIAANYDLDGIFFDCVFSEAGRTCYCEYCQKKFRADTGIDGIPENTDDKNYETYIRWHNNCYDSFRRRIIDAVRKGNDSLPISINWYNVARDPQNTNDIDVDFLSQDVWPDNILACEQIQAKNWAFCGKPFSLMNNLSPQWWTSYDIKPTASLIQEAMVPIINGGYTWTGFQIYQNYSTTPLVMRTVKELFSFIKGIENVFNNKQIMPHVAVLNCTEQLNYSRGITPFNTQVDETSLIGVNRVLTSSGIHYNSMNEQDLLKYIHQFKCVIIANNQYVSPALYKSLKNYVKNGGKLIITGISGNVDTDGKFIKNADFTDLTGVSVIEEMKYPYSYIKANNNVIDSDTDHMPIVCADRFTRVKNNIAESLAKIMHSYFKSENAKLSWPFVSFSAPYDVTEYDAITVNEYGKGRVVYFAADFFKGYVGINNYRLKKLIKSVINDILLCDDAILTNAPSVIELTVMQDKGNNNMLVNLLNCMYEHASTQGTIRSEWANCEDVLPIYNIYVELPLSKAPKELETVFSKEKINFEFDGKKLHFTVPKVEIYEGVEIIF